MSKEFKKILSESLIEDIKKEKPHWTLTPPREPGLYFVSRGDLGRPAHETKTTYVVSVVRLDIPRNSIWYSDGVTISMNPELVWTGYWYSKPIKVPKFKKRKDV